MSKQSLHQKLVLLGSSGVGKTSIVIRKVADNYTEANASTIGAAFFTTTVATKSKLVKFEVWDTAGQERYRSLTPLYYRNAHAILIVYDITSLTSFTDAQDWIYHIRATTDIVNLVLLGNKSDLASRRVVSEERAKNLACEHDIEYYEVSAKTGFNVDNIFTSLARAADINTLKCNIMSTSVPTNSDTMLARARGCC